MPAAIFVPDYTFMVLEWIDLEADAGVRQNALAACAAAHSQLRVLAHKLLFKNVRVPAASSFYRSVSTSRTVGDYVLSFTARLSTFAADITLYDILAHLPRLIQVSLPPSAFPIDAPSTFKTMPADLRYVRITPDDDVTQVTNHVGIVDVLRRIRLLTEVTVSTPTTIPDGGGPSNCIRVCRLVLATIPYPWVVTLNYAYLTHLRFTVFPGKEFHWQRMLDRATQLTEVHVEYAHPQHQCNLTFKHNSRLKYVFVVADVEQIAGWTDDEHDICLGVAVTEMLKTVGPRCRIDYVIPAWSMDYGWLTSLAMKTEWTPLEPISRAGNGKWDDADRPRVRVSVLTAQRGRDFVETMRQRMREVGIKIAGEHEHEDGFGVCVRGEHEHEHDFGLCVRAVDFIPFFTSVHI
jgi:hypothetical protein